MNSTEIKQEVTSGKNKIQLTSEQMETEIQLKFKCIQLIVRQKKSFNES